MNRDSRIRPRQSLRTLFTCLVVGIALPLFGMIAWLVMGDLGEATANAEEQARRGQQAVFIAIGLLALLLLARWWLSKVFLRPLGELADVADRIAAGAADVRAPVHGPIEIAALASQFNRVLDNVEAQQRERAALLGRYERLLQLARDAFMLVDETGRIVEVNEAAVALYDYSAEELKALDVWKLCATGQSTEFEWYWKASASPGGAQFESTHRRKDGSAVVVELSASAVLIDGKPHRQCFMRDITRRKEMNQALRETLDRLQEAQHIGRIGDWNYDFASGEVTWSNELFELNGRDRNRPPRDLEDSLSVYDEVSRQGFRSTLARCAAEQAQAECELLAKLPDGRTAHHHLVLVPAVQGAAVGCVHGTVQDITGRREAEEALRRMFVRVQDFLATIGRMSSSGALLAGDVDQFVREVTECASALMGAERTNVWLFEAGESRLRCIDLFEATPARHSSGMVLDEAQFSREFEALKSLPYVAADDAMTDPRTAGYVESYLRPLRIKSMLDLVIRADGRNLGLLCIEHVDRAHHWEDHEISFASQLADKVGFALLSRERQAFSSALSERERQLATLMSHLPGMAYRCRNDAEWSALFVSDGCIELTGYTPDDFTEDGPMTFAQVVLDEDRAALAPQVQAALAARQPYRLTFRIRTREGAVKWLLEQGEGVFDESGELRFLEGFAFDITDQKVYEQAVLDRGRQQTLIAEFGRQVLATTDFAEVSQYAADVICEGLHVGYSKVVEAAAGGQFVVKAGRGWQHEVVGTQLAVDDPDELRRCLLVSNDPIVIDDFAADLRFRPSALLVEHGIASGMQVPIRSAGGVYGILGAYSRTPRKFSPDDLSFLVSVANVIGAALLRKRAEERAAHLAQYDALTDLPNRVLFQDRAAIALSQARRAGSSLGVIFLDLDRFKAVNDSLGHALGDALLREVGARLNTAVRGSDTVCRYGGDEFVIMVPGLADERDAARVAEKVTHAISQPFTIENTELVVTGSVGVACYPADGEDLDVLLRNADAAMYAAKEYGRNCYQFYSADMNRRARERLLLEADLRRAIERAELYLDYQPQWDLANRRIFSVEALLRWRHPERGTVRPDVFIPIAEESGLIVQIGTWVLNEACRQQARWLASNVPMEYVAVNVSALQFRQANFVLTVEQALAEAALAPEHLELEVTESVVMDGAGVAEEKLNKLAAMGVRLAIDDFGTGYSSLAYLKRFPIGRLKIDQSFVRGLPHDRGSAAIANAVISLGHSLGLEVTAEGIETEEQARYLMSLACDGGQGYLVARPASAQDCARLIAGQARKQSSA